ncbi:unnamed protein product [Porites evermanni]|uniref:Uncharacterized protein n=1 Tax=Porites evermanni TaxID=104178 RepID=A0ABN8LCW3_9CNID|nr:unnamed protein product [Porites evermanni]
MSNQDTQQYTSVTDMENERVSQVDAPPLPEEQHDEKVDLATEPSQPSHKSRSSPSSRRRNYRKRSASESPERSPNRRSPDHSPSSHRRRRNSDYKGVVEEVEVGVGAGAEAGVQGEEGEVQVQEM